MQLFIINKIITFIKSLYLLRICVKRFTTNQNSFHTDTHVFLILPGYISFFLC